jgi:carbamoyl-phosphate synthase / aspartate carbamoyltransferase
MSVPAIPPPGSANLKNSNARPAISRSQSYAPNGAPAPPIAAPQLHAGETKNAPDAVLELLDGTAFRGISFGAPGKSVAGECVFQTGARAAPPTSLLLLSSRVNR